MRYANLSSTYTFDYQPSSIRIKCDATNVDNVGWWKITYEYFSDTGGTGLKEHDIYNSGTSNGATYGNNDGWCDGEANTYIVTVYTSSQNDAASVNKLMVDLYFSGSYQPKTDLTATVA